MSTFSEKGIPLEYRTVEVGGGIGYTRQGSERFYKILAEMAELHHKKSHDYANDNDPFGNYRFAGTIANMFAHSNIDAGFAGRLAEKIFRLSVLEGSGKIPKNESIADTELDIAVIATLWMAARQDSRGKEAKAFYGEAPPAYAWENPGMSEEGKRVMDSPANEPITKYEEQTLWLLQKIGRLINEFLKLPH
jgi:hypothetical protein